MRHDNLSARIVALVLIASAFLLLPAQFAKAQLPTAPYQVIDLYTMSAGSARLEYNPLPGSFIPAATHFEQLAANGEFLANTSVFPTVSGSAYLWSGSSTPTALNPTGTGFSNAYAAGTDGVQQVGAAFNGINGNTYATVWNGTAASAVDLNPSQLSATSSIAFGVKNGQQVGYSIINSSLFGTATVWNGSAASAVLLSPLSVDSQAFATDGAHQVGFAGVGANSTKHAVLWTGTPSSMVDLNPAAFASQAVTIAGGQEGGYAESDYQHFHPAIWTGSPDSYVDLTPPALAARYPASYAGIITSTNGTQQVGYFGPGAYSQGTPMIWSGTADSAELLPTFGTNFIFTPYNIDDAGNIFGIAEDPSTAQLYAVEWVPTPEPGSIGLFACGAFGLLLRRRRRE